MAKVNDCDFCQELTPKFFQKLIANSDPGVTIEGIKVSTGSGRGDNYTSQLYRVLAEGSSSQPSIRRWAKSFICKILPVSQARRDAFKSESLFYNEVAFYTHALPALTKFQSSLNFCIFNEAPIVYLAKPNIIVLEDLKEEGFVMIDRKKALDVMHCQAILKTLGHLHGVSLAMKTIQPQIFKEEVTGRIKECLFKDENEDWYKNYYRKAGERALRMLKEGLEGNPSAAKYLDRFNSFISDGFFKEMVRKIQSVEPMAVLCHGDCWTNNFLFQYDESGRISALRMLDFQFARYGSPALDLVYLLFNCTNEDVGFAQLPQLLKGYCESLEQTLQLLSCPNDVLGPRSIFKIIEEEIVRCSSIGLGMAIEMIPICTCDSDEAPDLYEQDGNEKDKENSTNDSLEITLNCNSTCLDSDSCDSPCDTVIINNCINNNRSIDVAALESIGRSSVAESYKVFESVPTSAQICRTRITQLVVRLVDKHII